LCVGHPGALAHVPYEHFVLCDEVGGLEFNVVDLRWRVTGERRRMVGGKDEETKIRERGGGGGAIEIDHIVDQLVIQVVRS
jgi:hypothetical protein